jgi:outer membrane protein assembly factor BamB
VLVIGDLVIATPGGKSFMVALNKKTGKTVWKSGPFGPAHYSSPIHVVYKGVPVIINGAGKGIICIHAETGKILWANEFASGNMANVPTPAFEDGYVFWAVGYNKGGICLKLSVSGQEVKAKEVWRTNDIRTQYGGYVILDGYIYGNNIWPRHRRRAWNSSATSMLQERGRAGRIRWSPVDASTSATTTTSTAST